MNKMPPIFYQFKTQVLYFLLVPIFFVSFVLIYRPFDIDDYLDMERGLFAFNITMMSCILLVTLVITRIIFYLCKLELSSGWYLFWCGCEVLICAHFVTLYMWLMSDMSYLSVLGHACGYLASVMFYPYIIIGVALRLNHAKNHANEPAENQRIRFYDDRHNLKLMVHANNVLYIEAEENYVRIFYIENNRQKNFQLRSTMKSIEDLCQANGLIRCHRSYYINKNLVKMLRKGKDGIILVELESPDTKLIPVSKRYYEGLANLL